MRVDVTTIPKLMYNRWWGKDDEKSNTREDGTSLERRMRCCCCCWLRRWRWQRWRQLTTVTFKAWTKFGSTFTFTFTFRRSSTFETAHDYWISQDSSSCPSYIKMKMNTESWWNDTDRVNLKYTEEKNPPSATLSIINLTRTGLGKNPGVRAFNYFNIHFLAARNGSLHETLRLGCSKTRWRLPRGTHWTHRYHRDAVQVLDQCTGWLYIDTRGGGGGGGNRRHKPIFIIHIYTLTHIYI